MPVTGTGSTRLELSLKRPSSGGELEELIALGVLSGDGTFQPAPPAPGQGRPESPIEKHAIRAGSVLNEAYDYPRPSSFTRGIRFDVGDRTMLLISGTASINDAGETVHQGDFRAQLWRTYRNISALLESEGADWDDQRSVVDEQMAIAELRRNVDLARNVRPLFEEVLADQRRVPGRAAGHEHDTPHASELVRGQTEIHEVDESGFSVDAPL